ncbi:polycystin-1-related protein isoform X2 [Hydra vulgaris]|uniref:polycystin-1-related protein isoform X2 n=1 Tax=Hydra vulgaris TaxID=6087 RepID=UPI001F5F1E1F|nr:polycystic kidney disease 1-related protein isoform X2 [Hydra vulgaris]
MAYCKVIIISAIFFAFINIGLSNADSLWKFIKKIDLNEENCFFKYVSNFTIQDVNQSICNCSNVCLQKGYLHFVSINDLCFCTNRSDYLRRCSCPKNLNCSLYNTDGCCLSYFKIKSSILEMGKNASIFCSTCNNYEYDSINFTSNHRSFHFTRNVQEKNSFEFVVNTQYKNESFYLCLTAFDIQSNMLHQCWFFYVYPSPIILLKIENVTDMANGSVAVQTNSCFSLNFTINGNFSVLLFNISNGFSKEIQFKLPSHKCHTVIGSTFFSYPGVYSMTITAKSSDFLQTHVQHISDLFVVQDEIQYVCLESTYGFLGMVSSFKAKIYGSHSNIKFEWYFREENTTIFTDTPECQYNISYNASFLFPVQLTARNFVSSRTTEYDVIIVPYIKEVIITPNKNPVLEEDHVNFTVIINKPITLWHPKFSYLWTFQIDSHINTHKSNLLDFIAPSSGVMFVTLSVTSDLLTVNGSCLLYIIKRIKPFQVHYKTFQLGEITSFSGFFNVAEYDASFFNIDYNPKILWVFGDAQQMVSSDIAVKHKYNRTGVFFAYVNVSNILSSYTSYVKVYVLSEPCDLEIYFPLDWDTLKDIQLYENIVFNPRVEVNCLKATNISFMWEFEKDHLKEYSKVFKFFEPTLNIPASAIGVGTWKFHFTVYLDTQNVFRNYTNTLRINRGGLKAVIRNNGVRFINFNLKSSILLISDSFDQDKPDEKTYLRYSWQCYTEKYTNCFKSGFPSQSLNGSWLIFFPYELVESSKRFLFILTVEKDGIPPDEDTILFKVDTRVKLQTAIMCDTCKENGYSSFAKMKFHVVCAECKGKEVTYFWSVKFRYENSPLLTNFHKCMPTSWPAALLKNYDGLFAPANLFPLAVKTALSNQIIDSRCINYMPVYSSDQSCSQINFVNEACLKSNQTVRSNFLYSMKKMYKATDSTTFNKESLIPNTISWTKDSILKTTITDQKKEYNQNKYLELKADKDLSQYFTDRSNYYSRAINKGDYIYDSNKENFLIQANSLIPGQPYEISVNIFNGTKQDPVIASSIMYFKTEEPPIKGSCFLIRNETGTEFKTVYSIKCENWKSNHTLLYTVTSENNEVIVHSYVFTFDFILSVDFTLNGKKANLIVTIEDEDGRWISLCPLSVTVFKNSNVSYYNIFSMLNEIESKKLVTDANLDLQKITVLLHKFNRIFANHSNIEESYRIKEKVCKLLPKYIYQTPVRMAIRAFSLILENPAELSANCTYWMLQSLNEMIRFRQSKQLFRRGKYQTFINDSNNIVSKLLYISKCKSIDEFKLIYQYQRIFMKFVMQEYFLNETITVQSDTALSVFGHKGFRKNWIVQPDLMIDIKNIGYMYLTITLFNKSFCWLDQSSVYMVDVNILNDDSHHSTMLSKQQNSSEHFFDLSFNITHVETTSYTLEWGKINFHEFILSDEDVEKFHFIFEIKEQSVDYHNFYIRFVVRYNSNKKNLTWIFQEELRNHKFISSFSPKDIEFASSFNATFEIVPTNQRIIQKYKVFSFKENPWISYMISMKSSFCKHWDPFKNFVQSKQCYLADTLISSELVCRCKGNGLVTGYVKTLDQQHFIMIPVHRFKKSFVVIAGIVLLLALFFIMMAYSCYVYRNFPSYNVVIDLPDNLSCDKYIYYMAIETGHSYGSGTSSRICAVLYGENGCSQKFEITCSDKRFMFQRSSTDILLLRCPIDLGQLTHLLLWHNNQGSSPDWYLKQVIIKSPCGYYYFALNNWLSLSRGLHKIHCNLIATSEPCTSRFQLFLESYIDYNIWLSILLGPVVSQFSMSKRLGYLLSKILFFTSGSIVLFKEEINKNKGILGLFHILSITHLMTPALLVVMYIPISMVLTYFIRFSLKNPPKKRRFGRFNKVEDIPNQSFELTEIKKVYPDFLSDDQLSCRSSFSKSEQSKKLYSWSPSLRLYLHYISLCILALVVTLCLGIIVWKSLMVENNGLELSWMQFTILSVLWDLLVITPVLSSIKSLVVSSSNLKNYYEELFNSSHYSENTKNFQPFDLLSVRHRARFLRYAAPEKSNKMKLLTFKRVKEKVMKSYLRKVTESIVLLFVVTAIATSNDVKQSYNANQNIRNILNNWNISTVNDLWNWSLKCLLPVLNNVESLQDNKCLMLASLIGVAKFSNKNSSYTGQSMVEIQFIKLPNKNFLRKLNVESFTFKSALESSLIHFVALILLSLLTFWFFVKLYLKFIQKGAVAFFDAFNIFKLCLTFCGSFVCGVNLVKWVLVYALNVMLDMADYSSDFLDLTLYSNFKKIEYISKGLLLCLASFYFIFSIGIPRKLLGLFSILKSSLKKVVSYFIFFAVCVAMFSHVLFIIYQTRMLYTMNFAFVLQVNKRNHNKLHNNKLSYKMFHLNELHYACIGTLFGVITLLFLKMSCIIFIGKIKNKKLEQMPNKFSSLYLLHDSWIYYNKQLQNLFNWTCFKDRFQKLFIKKVDDNNDWTVYAPQECIYQEINYQLEEIIYRVGLFTESEVELSQETVESSIESEHVFEHKCIYKSFTKEVVSEKYSIDTQNNGAYCNPMFDDCYEVSQFQKEISNDGLMNLRESSNFREAVENFNSLFKRFLLDSEVKNDSKVEQTCVTDKSNTREKFNRFLIKDAKKFDMYCQVDGLTDSLTGLKKVVREMAYPKADCTFIEEDHTNATMKSETYLSKFMWSTEGDLESQKLRRNMMQTQNPANNGKKEEPNFNRFLLHSMQSDTNNQMTLDDIRFALNCFSNTMKTLSKEESLLRLKDLEEDIIQTNVEKRPQEYLDEWMSLSSLLLSKKRHCGNLDSGLGSV